MVPHLVCQETKRKKKKKCLLCLIFIGLSTILLYREIRFLGKCRRVPFERGLKSTASLVGGNSVAGASKQSTPNILRLRPERHCTRRTIDPRVRSEDAIYGVAVRQAVVPVLEWLSRMVLRIRISAR